MVNFLLLVQVLICQSQKFIQIFILRGKACGSKTDGQFERELILLFTALEMGLVGFMAGL